MTTNFGDNRRKFQLGISVGNFMALTNSSGLEYNSVTVVKVRLDIWLCLNELPNELNIPERIQ